MHSITTQYHYAVLVSLCSVGVRIPACGGDGISVAHHLFSFLTSHFSRPISHFSLPIYPFSVLTSQCLLLTSPFPHLTAICSLSSCLFFSWCVGCRKTGAQRHVAYNIHGKHHKRNQVSQVPRTVLCCSMHCYAHMM